MSKDIEMTDKDVTRFLAKVGSIEPNGCRYWKGSCSKNGYGTFGIGLNDFYAHRVAYFLATGKQPGKLDVMHSCDTPPCVNPDHLTSGTRNDNMLDASRKGRLGVGKGERHARTKLSDNDVLEIRSARQSGESRESLAARFNVTPQHISSLNTQRRRKFTPKAN